MDYFKNVRKSAEGDLSHQISEYRGEFEWNFKEGFSREGRRDKANDKQSVDVKQLKLLKKKEQAAKESTEKRGKLSSDKAAVVIDRHGDEYEVCETAKEAVERLVKSDPRLADKYRQHVKRMEEKFKPYGTSYGASFMKTTNMFPTVRAYEMAAEEFERNQDLFQGPLKASRAPSDASSDSKWETDVSNYGKTAGSIAGSYMMTGTSGNYSSLDDTQSTEDRQKTEKKVTFADEEDSLRRKWVDKAHSELARTFEADPKTTDQRRERSEHMAPLWLTRGLQRKGLL